MIYQRSSSFGCKDIVIRKSEFVVRTQLLYNKTPDKKEKNGFAEKEEKNLKQKHAETK